MTGVPEHLEDGEEAGFGPVLYKEADVCALASRIYQRFEVPAEAARTA
jgi:hypothetical protein